MGQVQGRYEPGENILHLWFPRPVALRDEAGMRAFFEEVLHDFIEKTHGRFWLLVDYTNLRIHPEMTDAYARSIGRFQARLLGTFRYNCAVGFTGVAVSLGNLKLAAPSRLYPDEASARAALREARSR